MFGFENGDRVKTKDGKMGYVIRNFIGSTYFMIEEVRDNKRIGLFLVVNRDEITKVEDF